MVRCSRLKFARAVNAPATDREKPPSWLVLTRTNLRHPEHHRPIFRCTDNLGSLVVQNPYDKYWLYLAGWLLWHNMDFSFKPKMWQPIILAATSASLASTALQVGHQSQSKETVGCTWWIEAWVGGWEQLFKLSRSRAKQGNHARSQTNFFCRRSPCGTQTSFFTALTCKCLPPGACHSQATRYTSCD